VAAYASAWESLKDSRLSRDDRIRAQSVLLAEWLRHDLAAALVAFYSNPDDLTYFEAEFFRGQLRPAMAANSKVVEDLLGSGALGLQARSVRDAWFLHLMKTEPVEVLDRLDELPGAWRINRLADVVERLLSAPDDTETRYEALERFSERIAADRTGRDVQVIGSVLARGWSNQEIEEAYLANNDPHLKDLFAWAGFAKVERLGQVHLDDGLPPGIQSFAEPFRSVVTDKWKESRTVGGPRPPLSDP
jgi:hypothetical protein